LEAKLRCLVDANLIGIFLWGLDGRIIEANDAFLRMVGYSRDDLVAGRMNWRDLTPAEYHDADDRRVAQLQATGTAPPRMRKSTARKAAGAYRSWLVPPSLRAGSRKASRSCST
jgi:PAS domain S-box-containing protein